MKPNMGSTDRIVRVVVAVIFAALYLTGIVRGTIGVILLILAVVFVLTSVVRFCPLYLPLGMNTNKSE